MFTKQISTAMAGMISDPPVFQTSDANVTAALTKQKPANKSECLQSTPRARICSFPQISAVALLKTSSSDDGQAVCYAWWIALYRQRQGGSVDWRQTAGSRGVPRPGYAVSRDALAGSGFSSPNAGVCQNGACRSGGANQGCG